MAVQRRKIKMDMKVSEVRTEATPAQSVPPPSAREPPTPDTLSEGPERLAPNRIPSIIVGVVVALVAALSIFYLVRGQPLLVQGEVDATRLDIAARVDGRVGEVAVTRGQN